MACRSGAVAHVVQGACSAEANDLPSSSDLRTHHTTILYTQVCRSYTAFGDLLHCIHSVCSHERIIAYLSTTSTNSYVPTQIARNFQQNNRAAACRSSNTHSKLSPWYRDSPNSSFLERYHYSEMRYTKELCVFQLSKISVVRLKSGITLSGPLDHTRGHFTHANCVSCICMVYIVSADYFYLTRGAMYPSRHAQKTLLARQHGSTFLSQPSLSLESPEISFQLNISVLIDDLPSIPLSRLALPCPRHVLLGLLVAPLPFLDLCV